MQFLLINALDCLAISLFLYLLVVFRDHIRRGGLPYPPGPPSRPIIGNLPDIPKDAPWRAYADMSEKYGRREHSRNTCPSKLKPTFPGDVICLHVLSQAVIVLNSFSAIKDLLEKRGQIYSDRPRSTIAEMYVLWCSYFPIGCHAQNT
jgi:hypothetical protein